MARKDVNAYMAFVSDAISRDATENSVTMFLRQLPADAVDTWKAPIDARLDFNPTEIVAR